MAEEDNPATTSKTQPAISEQHNTLNSTSDKEAEVQPEPVGVNTPEPPQDLSPAPHPGGTAEDRDDQLGNAQGDVPDPSSIRVPVESPAPSTTNNGPTAGQAVPVCPGPAAPGTARCHSLVRPGTPDSP